MSRNREGKRVPQATFHTRRNHEWIDLTSDGIFDGKTVVVTHHAPSSRLVHPRYARDQLTPAFASSLEMLMRDLNGL